MVQPPPNCEPELLALCAVLWLARPPRGNQEPLFERGWRRNSQLCNCSALSCLTFALCSASPGQCHILCSSWCQGFWHLMHCGAFVNPCCQPGGALQFGTCPRLVQTTIVWPSCIRHPLQPLLSLFLVFAAVAKCRSGEELLLRVMRHPLPCFLLQGTANGALWCGPSETSEIRCGRSAPNGPDVCCLDEVCPHFLQGFLDEVISFKPWRRDEQIVDE